MRTLDRERTRWFLRNILPHEPSLRAWLTRRHPLGLEVEDIIQEAYAILADLDGLDGIVYPTETWGARGVSGLPSQASAAARLDTAKGPAARLFAFGFDAWLVTAYLERLALSNNADIAGATGRLSLDGFGNVLRRPSWSRYAGGVPVPLGDGPR